MSFAKVPGTNWLINAQHLKIWRTTCSLKNGNRIYVGLVNANKGLKFGIIPRVSKDLNTERELLYRDLNHTGKLESHHKVQLVPPLIGYTFTGDNFFSDGNAYVISIR